MAAAAAAGVSRGRRGEAGAVVEQPATARRAVGVPRWPLIAVAGIEPSAGVARQVGEAGSVRRSGAVTSANQLAFSRRRLRPGRARPGRPG